MDLGKGKWLLKPSDEKLMKIESNRLTSEPSDQYLQHKRETIGNHVLLK